MWELLARKPLDSLDASTRGICVASVVGIQISGCASIVERGRCRTIQNPRSQPRSNSGLGFQEKQLQTIELFPFRSAVDLAVDAGGDGFVGPVVPECRHVL